jgi:hypothetical protein
MSDADGYTYNPLSAMRASASQPSRAQENPVLLVFPDDS